ncbi:MAG: CDP-glycerol glycerophosphotransferase family protein [Gammaproteobacteria bacterium]|nr:CDP-glycerol glycerophosphotransferase family protein [Gammaproteobacteria bacterium]
MIKNILKTIGKYIFYIPKTLIPKSDIVLFSCHDYQEYSGNSRFLYEYLSKHSNLNAYWITNNSTVKDHLTSQSLKYISYSNILKSIWIMLRTKIVVSSGDAYVDLFSILENKNVYKVSITHGFGPKTDRLKLDSDLIRKIHRFDYVNFPSKYTCDNNGSKLYKLPKEKIISYGYPKNDGLYDVKDGDQKYKNKSLIKKLFPDLDLISPIVILYTPTWRDYETEIPLVNIKGFTEDRFSDFLEEKNIIFIYSPHPINRPNISINNRRFASIKNDKTLIDINNLMHETDILMNDYSTTSIDYCITDKPQIFCLPDHQIYKKHVSLDEDYLYSLPGHWINSFEKLESIINKIILNKKEYVEKYHNKVQRYLNKYYDIENKRSSEMLTKFFIKLINSSSKKF